MKNQAIYPGKVWLDTNGNRIQAHGGSIMYIDGVYYWYGENKEKTDGVNGIWHWGVKCYSSTDLYNWEDRGIIIPPEPGDPTSSLHPESCMENKEICMLDENYEQRQFPDTDRNCNGCKSHSWSIHEGERRITAIGNECRRF